MRVGVRMRVRVGMRVRVRVRVRVGVRVWVDGSVGWSLLMTSCSVGGGCNDGSS